VSGRIAIRSSGEGLVPIACDFRPLPAWIVPSQIDTPVPGWFVQQPPCIRTLWPPCRATSSALLLSPVQANVAEFTRRMLAPDEQRAGRGAAGSRLLRWHSDSAAKLITRACSRVGGALRSRLSSDPRPRRKRETPAAWSSASPTPRRPARGRLEHAWGVFGAFALSRAVSAGPGISAIHGKLIPRNPHQGHTGSTRNDGVGGSSPPVGFGSSS
jgi:hypothetical protein